MTDTEAMETGQTYGGATLSAPEVRKPREPKVSGDVQATFNVKCTMKLRWVPQFLSMLDEMQNLGAMGSSRCVSIFADGDGDFRPIFEHHVKYNRVKADIGEGDARQFDAG